MGGKKGYLDYYPQERTYIEDEGVCQMMAAEIAEKATFKGASFVDDTGLKVAFGSCMPKNMREAYHAAIDKNDQQEFLALAQNRLNELIKPIEGGTELAEKLQNKIGNSQTMASMD